MMEPPLFLQWQGADEFTNACSQNPACSLFCSCLKVVIMGTARLGDLFMQNIWGGCECI